MVVSKTYMVILYHIALLMPINQVVYLLPVLSQLWIYQNPRHMNLTTLYNNITLKNVNNISNATLVGFTGLWNSELKFHLVPVQNYQIITCYYLIITYISLLNYSISVGVGNLMHQFYNNSQPNVNVDHINSW